MGKCLKFQPIRSEKELILASDWLRFKTLPQITVLYYYSRYLISGRVKLFRVMQESGQVFNQELQLLFGSIREVFQGSWNYVFDAGLRDRH